MLKRDAVGVPLTGHDEKRFKLGTDTAMGDEPGRRALTRQPSLLLAQPHAGSPAVTLRPRLKMDSGVISRVIISRLQRTPSPFTGRMGDHTVAWQAVVDSVHAMFCGLTLDQAVVALQAKQNAAASWMLDRDCDERKLLALLEDSVARRSLLEDAAHQAQAFLVTAGSAVTPAAKQGALEQAIAWHLTYVNYLPFATVPAKSKRGSRGSGEGTRRMTLLDVERASQPQIAEGLAADAGALADSLWKMFAFDAALREANVEMAVVPATVAVTSATQKTLSRLATQCVAHIDNVVFAAPKTRQRSAKRWDGMKKPVQPQLILAEIESQAKPFAAKNDEYDELTKLAQDIVQAAEALRTLNQGGLTIGDLDSLYDRRDKINTRSIQSAQLNTDVTEQSKDAVKNAALILAHLLHDHQVTVARAYPRSVIISGFLQKSHVEAAFNRLSEVIAQDFKKADTEKKKALLDTVSEKLTGLGEPVIATANDWAAGAATEELVVTYTAGQPLRVNGRAPAPAGVAGMGSHTTAWIVEWMATDALISDAVKTGTDPVRALQDAVKGDLAKGTITLDCLLPSGQLEGGQLEGILDTALEVLAATDDVAEAATAFLEFRNLLPYATVDEGDRIGHLEDAFASEKVTFDSEAMKLAAETQADTLFDAKRRETSSKTLVQTADRLSKHPNPNWNDEEAVKNAKEAIVARLRAQAAAQQADVPDRGVILDRIMTCRLEEHSRTYKLSRGSVMAS